MDTQFFLDRRFIVPVKTKVAFSIYSSNFDFIYELDDVYWEAEQINFKGYVFVFYRQLLLLKIWLKFINSLFTLKCSLSKENIILKLWY